MMIKPAFRPSTDFLRSVGQKAIDSDFGTELPEASRDTLVLATGGGALVGAALGTYLGFHSQQANTVQEQWPTHGIDHPHLTGYSHTAVPDYTRVCHTEGSGADKHEVCHDRLDGWWHRYSPNIDWNRVGTYTAPEFHNSKWAEPLLGGFLGALGGGLLGLGLGVGINAIQHSLQHDQVGTQTQPLPESGRASLETRAGLLALGGATVGMLGGGVLGHVAGVIEQAQKEVHTREWMGPVLQNQRIGEIPSDYYEHNVGLGFPGLGIGFGKGSSQGVYRDVPLYNSDGTPQLQPVRHTFDTARYGPVGGAIMGGLIGGGVGLAAGVAAGTLLKMVETRSKDNKPPQA
ncbi:MAG: hypothetical protein U0931_31565 [Vulcanimicrobiota bacterium]